MTSKKIKRVERAELRKLYKAMGLELKNAR